MKNEIQDQDKEYFQVMEEFYSIGNGELLTRLVGKLQAQNRISKGLESEDVLEGSIKDSEKKIIKEETEKILTKRKEILGYNTITGYHTSTNKYELGNKIPTGLEGKVYFSDIDSLYAARGRKSMNYIYQVSAEGKQPDVRDGWHFSRTPLTVLKRWTVEDFIKEYPQARFL